MTSLSGRVVALGRVMMRDQVVVRDRCDLARRRG
jgi:hypothetical protein